MDTISGASTLEFNSAVSSSTTVGSQNIGFTGGGTLDLTDPTSFFWRDLGLRNDRHGRTLGLMGLFQLLREFRRHSGHADARKRHDHARFRLRRQLHAGRFQNYLGSDLDHHTHVTQRRRAGAQRPGGVRELDQRLRQGRRRIERHDLGRSALGLYRFHGERGGTQGDLGFVNGSSTLSLTLIGDYNPADFVHQSGPRESTLIT